MIATLHKRAFVVLACVLLLVGAQAFAQAGQSWRKALGEPRASIMEALVKALYPGSPVSWAPQLTVQAPGGAPRSVQFPGFVILPASDGLLDGVTSLDLGKSKEEFIFRAQSLRENVPQTFPTDLILFRATQAGQVQSFRRIAFEPSDPLIEIKVIDLQRWPELRMQYQSHFVAADSFTTIEWNAAYDPANGRMVTRFPTGISRKREGNQEELAMLSISRSSPNWVQVTDVVSKKSVPYACSDPCVFDGPTLIGQWFR